MSKRRKDENYEYISEETIRKACEGDGKALNTVIYRYQNYARKCFRAIATTKYNLDMKDLPMEDLM